MRCELETGTDCHILTQVLLTIAGLLSFSSWLGLLNRGSLRAQSPLSAAGSHFDILSPTDSNWLEPPRAPGYIIVSRPSASAVLPLIYTGDSLDWRLGPGSICYNRRLFFLFLLNHGRNVSGYFSIQKKIANFPNSWWILLYTLVTWNVTMSVFFPVGRACRIHRLNLCRRVRPPQRRSWIWH